MKTNFYPSTTMKMWHNEYAWVHGLPFIMTIHEELMFILKTQNINTFTDAYREREAACFEEACRDEPTISGAIISIKLPRYQNDIDMLVPLMNHASEITERYGLISPDSVILNYSSDKHAGETVRYLNLHFSRKQEIVLN